MQAKIIKWRINEKLIKFSNPERIRIFHKKIVQEKNQKQCGKIKITS